MNLSLSTKVDKRIPLKEPVFTANPGPQSVFVLSNVFEILYGGRAGGGKAHPEDERVETSRGMVPVGDLRCGELLWNPVAGGYLPLEALTPQGAIPTARIVLEGGRSLNVSLGHLSAARLVLPEMAGSDLEGPVIGSQLLTTRQIERAMGEHGLAVYLPLSRGQEVVQRWRKVEAVEDLGCRESACLTVAGGEGLYAAGQGIATHNSAGLLIGAYRHLQQYGHAQHNAIIFRRSHAELKRAPVFQLAMTRFTALKQAGYPASFNGQDMVWDFQGNGKLHYGYLEAEFDHLRYAGPEFIYIGFDELTHFRPRHYKFMFTRLRGQTGTPCVIRGATNPGGPYHKFYFNRFRPWLDRSNEYMELVRKGAAPIADPGQVLYFLPPADADDKADSDENHDTAVPEGTPGSRGRTFLPAGIEHTPQYDTAQYNETLAFADATLRKQIRDGSWIDDDGGGTFFQKKWFIRERRIPAILSWVRSYDLAWGTSEGAKFTVGILGAAPRPGLYAENTVLIADMISMKSHEATTIEAIRRVAELDLAFIRMHGGGPLLIRLPEDSGKAGIDIRQRFVAALAGYDVRLIPDKGDKFMRARPVAAQAEYGNIRLLEGCHPSRDVAIELQRKGIVTETAVQWIDPLLSRLQKVDPTIAYEKQILDHMDALSSTCSLIWTPSFQPKAGFFRPGVG